MSMPEFYVEQPEEIRHSDEMHDIMTVVPSWILRCGNGLDHTRVQRRLGST